MLFFNHKKHRLDRVITLSDEELRLIKIALIRFRNRAIQEDFSTEDIDKLFALLQF